jgi:hypothetical protein
MSLRLKRKKKMKKSNPRKWFESQLLHLFQL